MKELSILGGNANELLPLSSHWCLMGYIQLFSGTRAPPVARRPPSQVFTASCMEGVSSSKVVWVSNAVHTKSVSSTKLQPTKLIFSFEMGVMNLAPWLLLRIMFNRGELIMTHRQGLAPLPCPLPCVGLPLWSVFP